MTCWRLLLSVFGSRILLALLGGVLLLAMADLAETSRQLAEVENPLSIIVIVYANLAPSLLLQALPVAVLLGVLLAITDLARSRELLAMRAAGAGSILLAAPPLLVSFLLAVFGIVLADHIAPIGVERATRIQMEELGRMRSAWSPFHSEHRWFASETGGIYHVGSVSTSGDHLKDIARYLHQSGRIKSALLIDEATYEKNLWTRNGTLAWWLDPASPSTVALCHEPDDRNRLGHQSIPACPNPVVSITETPGHFAAIGAHPEALTRQEIKKAISLRKAQGQPFLPFELEAKSRWTMPLLGLALAMVALGMGLARPPNTHVEAAAISIGVAFAAWTLLAVCRAMGLSGMLNPSIAAFLPVLLPAAMGLGLLFRWK